MAFSPDEGSADRLLTRLATSLFQQFASGELRALGWFQFRDHDRPHTRVSTELAAAAFTYLGLDDQGGWRDEPRLAVAVIAFLRQYHPGAGTPAQCQRLGLLVKATPVDRQAVADWFMAIFPPMPMKSPQQG